MDLIAKNVVKKSHYIDICMRAREKTMISSHVYVLVVELD